MNKINICHFTVAHRLEDERIFHKQCKSLSKVYNVYLLSTADFIGDYQGINVIGLDNPKSLFDRFTKIFTIIPVLLKTKSEVYHFHDPELVVTGLILKLIYRKKVIYDVHEHYQSKIASRLSNKKILGKLLAKIWGTSERLIAKSFDLMVAADSYVAKQFKPNKTIILPNVPPLSFMDTSSERKNDDETFNIVYLGTIGISRGLKECIEAVAKTTIPNVKLHIIGECKIPELLHLFETTENVIYHGRIPWENLTDTLSKMHIGMITLQPVPAYLYSPGENIVKLFDYASLGIPFVISDFPGIRKFVERNGGGLLVNPTDTDKIAKAIDKLYYNRKLYDRLSNECREFVKREYNWDFQEKKLLNAYAKILKK